MMNGIITRIYLTLCFAVLMCKGQPQRPIQTVLRVAAWTSTGERINKIWVVVTSPDGRERYTGNGRDVELSLPPGEYVLQTDAPGFKSKRQVLKAYRPTTFRSVMLPVAPVHGQADTRVFGRIVGYKGDLSTIRVRLMALYGSEVWEAVPDNEGNVTFPADVGSYILVTVIDREHGPKVIDSREIRLTDDQTVVIDLSGR